MPPRRGMVPPAGVASSRVLRDGRIASRRTRNSEPVISTSSGSSDLGIRPLQRSRGRATGPTRQEGRQGPPGRTGAATAPEPERRGGQQWPARNISRPKSKGGDLNGSGLEDSVERVETRKRKASCSASSLAEEIGDDDDVLHSCGVAVGNPVQNGCQFSQHHRLGEMHAPGRKPEPKCFRTVAPAGLREPFQALILNGAFGNAEWERHRWILAH